MDEDESRASARSQSPALKVDLPPEDESYVGDSSDAHADSVTEEQRLRAHLLQDVESSFVPPISPVRTAGPEGGIDDTFMFDASASSKKPPSPRAESRHDDHDEAADDDADTPRGGGGEDGQQRINPVEAEDPNDLRSTTPATATASEPDDDRDVDESQHDSYHEDSHDEYHTDQHSAHDESDLPAQNISSATPSSPMPASQLHESHADHSLEPGNTTSHLEQLSSSPTAAAAARTVSRAISMASQHAASGDDYSTSDAGQSFSRDSSRLRMPQALRSVASGASTTEDQTADLDFHKLSIDAGNTPGAALRDGNRPKYLRSRRGSQRSSTSSFTGEEDGHSDATVGLGADFAIQSGGAIPSGGMPRSLSNILSRSVSMGSWASGVDDLPDSSRALDPLEPLEEIDVSPERSRKLNGSDDNLATPRARKSNGLLAPTDTVIAKHVQNVEVPEALRLEYKTKNGLETPIKPFRKTMTDFTPAPGTAAKNGRSLTLKEQSSTIERLSKENFDLKLKVMFLSDRLDKLSEEGVKEMVSENVALKTRLAGESRDNKNLRRKIKELEQRLRDEAETRPSTAKSGYSSDGQAESPIDEDAEDREELLYLREQFEEHMTEIERLRSENMTNQSDKRRMAETIKAMGDRAGERDSLGREEEADVFKDLLEQETARREQADEDNRRLRDEIFRLKQEVNVAVGAPTGSTGSGPGGLHHTTNIYNITRKAKGSSPTRSRPLSGLSGDMDMGSMSQSSTLVDDLRRESEQLRHENAELRREVGAQTSMLTSRNREKERLYQEIEDLKLAQRRNGQAPSTIDTLLDRSASRAGGHERSQSRFSARTRLTMAPEDPAREEYETKLSEHRDKINELRLQNQELQRELETCMEDFEIAVEGKREAEETALNLQDELDNTMNDLIVIQNERDEALQEAADAETRFDNLRAEAQEEIVLLEQMGDQHTEEIQRLELEIQEHTDNFNALQGEMHKLSEAFMRLEDEHEQRYRRIEQLEAEMLDSNKEFEELEAKLVESNDKANRLGVQQESSQGEIAFLREEQEADKIRIGDLEAAVESAEQSLREERDRAKELDHRLATERRQRELLATREKEEIQQFVNDLNRELSTAKDESRRLRKNLTSREVEAAEWKERLLELENNLREALGDLNGTRSSLLKSIAKLQRELENTVRELDTTKASVLEKDRIIKQRDALLESHGLEGKKLAELLDKERQAHRNTKNSYETFQRTHQHVSRTVTNQDSRIVELESTRASDKKRLAHLENTLKDQLTERNNLLLVLWTKLSAVCGTDWAHDHNLINGRALPSLEAVATMLPGFSKNLLSAIKHIESVFGGFQTRIKGVEKDLWKEYQALENSLDVRSKKLDRLESIVRNGVASGDFSATTRISQLEAAIRALKIENATLMRANDAKTRAVGGYFDWRGDGDGKGDHDEYGSPSPHIPTGPVRKKPGDGELDGGRKTSLTKSKTTNLEASSSSKTRTSTMSRSASATTGAPPEYEATSSTSGGDGDTKWMFRLRELEHKLKQEREARNMDRSAAKQRILEGERQKDELVAELVRAKRRGGE